MRRIDFGQKFRGLLAISGGENKTTNISRRDTASFQEFMVNALHSHTSKLVIFQRVVAA